MFKKYRNAILKKKKRTGQAGWVDAKIRGLGGVVGLENTYLCIFYV